jgi:hypothetical protein
VAKQFFPESIILSLIPGCDQRGRINPPHPNPLPPQAGGEGIRNKITHLKATWYQTIIPPPAPVASVDLPLTSQRIIQE